MIKKIIIGGVALVVIALGTKAVAHSRLSETEKIEKITQKMAKKLKLTDEQKEKVYTINLERSKGHRAAYEAGRKKEIIVAAVKEWENSLKEVLDDKQIKKLGLK